MYSGTSKRRRTSMSSSASKEDETGSVDLEYQPDSKRKRTPKLDPIEQCQQLYDIIRNHKKEDGSLLSEPFIRVPKRRQEPAYYEVVSNPMDMIRIQQKIKMDEYEDVEQMSVDVDLMLTNAKAFYKRSTQEYKDACDLWDLFIESKCRLFDTDAEEGKGKIILKMGKLARRAAAAEARKPALGDIDGGETSESSTATDKDRHEDLDKGDNPIFNQLEELFSAIMMAKDGDDRPIHTVFQLLPSRKKYPSYYEVIDNPIDLKMIATKIQALEYSSLIDLEKDIFMMCRNACAFNEPGSQIYKDAKMLKKAVTAKKFEMEHGHHGRQSGNAPGKTSERIRNRRLRSGVSHSAITAALQYEEDDEEEEEAEPEEVESEESMEDDERVEDEEGEIEEEEEAYKGDLEDPMWVLFETIDSYTTPGGLSLSDPFKRLPSRRFYPDYYKEIKNPISLAQIRTSIQRGEYVNLTQIQADLNVMFENAKAYNIPESSLYKTAVKLQKVVQTKVQELLGPIGEEDSSNDDLGLVPKRSCNSTPLPTLTMEGDFEIMDKSDDTPNTSRTPGSGKKSAKLKVKDSVTHVTPLASPGIVTVSVPKASPTKDDKNQQKNIAFREQLKRRYQMLYQTIGDYKEADGRTPISLFMEKPSKKLYPDYYRVIGEPIDMVTIKVNIENDKYLSSDELMKDFQLMFNNCRQYNEEGSAIYEDANKLEKMLSERLRLIGSDPAKPKPKKKKNPALLLKQRKLLDIVRDHKDKNGRQLSLIFHKLPSKTEYPDYYEIIKNPMDLDRISTKQRTNNYDSLEQLSADLMLMFDNACKFNEPDSQIYKDALILQRLVLQTKLGLASEDDGLPDVPGAVKEILISIFTSVYNHQDEEGRCFTDTMSELPEFDEIDGQKTRARSLDLIKSRLDRGLYKRLDAFQRDIFLCFERARKLSRTDSQVFEDSVELQSFFIKARNEVCKNGETLKSPALSYTQADLEKEVEAMKLEKKSEEAPQEDDIPSVEPKKEESASILTSLSESYNEQTYCVGDFVYVNAGVEGSSGEGTSTGVSGASAKGLKPNVANIQKLWTAPDGTKWFEGIWFFRPDQTYHIPTRKFLQKEVFRSEVRSTAMLSEVVGKCWVMTVKGKEYFNYAPEGYADDDVYVCEYRYSSRGRCFTKLKSWAFGSDRVKLIPRVKALEPIRIASVFRERVEKHKEELQQMEDDMEKGPAEDYPNIELPEVPGKDDLRYFEQFNLACGPIRSGDFVYVRVEDAKKLVARVDSMWADANGTTFFHGPWFTSLTEISPTSVPPGRVFFKQEIFQSSIEDTNPLLSICGKCSVLDLDDYAKWRPTEISECDMFCCESLYDEARRQIKKFDGLKKYVYKDPRVHKDEVYFFRRPITLTRVDLDGSVIPEMPKLKAAMKMEPGSPMTGVKLELDSFMEDSMDAPSVSSLSDITGPGSVVNLPSGTTTPVSVTKKAGKTPGKKLVTGYIVYSSEVRRGVAERNPTLGFGEISRMVGTDWKKLSREQKTKYEDKAARLNEEKEIAITNGIDPATIGPGSQKVKDNAAKQEVDLAAATSALKKDPDWIFECCWGNCDWQFEDALDLIEHCVQEPKGHVATHFRDQNPSDGDFQCHWKNCARVKKGANPFPNLTRLLKHVRDIHILKANGRIIHPDMRSRNCVASRNPKPRAFIGVGKTHASVSSMSIGSSIGNVASSAILIPASSPPLIHPAVASATPLTQHVQQVIVRASAPPQEPLFVAVPPRPQKLLHSEAYIRYIESLHAEKRHITNWEQSLKASKDTTETPSADMLPSHWLANGAGAHGSVTNALWALRDFMMRDSLNLHRSMKR